jgi:hypothetical protein
MDIRLPAPLDIYFASESAHDPSAIEKCFAANAIVRDEGKTFAGIPAIKAWRVEAGEKYQHVVGPLARSLREGKVVVKCKVSGDFPGSPVHLERIFEINDDRITCLEIR